MSHTELLPPVDPGLVAALERACSGVGQRPTGRLARAHDAYHYLVVPQAVAVIVPEAWGCCGFAGDRGMLRPELTESATRLEAAEVSALSSDAYASVNRTCELGMSRATGQRHRHVFEVLDEALSEELG